MYQVRNENAKLNICIKTTAENECSVQWEGKLSNQSVTNVDCVSSLKIFLILFCTVHVAEFALSHFAFYTHLFVLGWVDIPRCL